MGCYGSSYCVAVSAFWSKEETCETGWEASTRAKKRGVRGRRSCHVRYARLQYHHYFYGSSSPGRIVPHTVGAMMIPRGGKDPSRTFLGILA